uniref:Uncharacterized protein n=1 Tax=Siphoviridae sp. ctqPo10 TaxID=2827948 RepID=A0A8S5SVS6_9CAUD|nr:MAG TPA: hypothetical protein [Siphoviridae sp. ctqPo10]
MKPINGIYDERYEVIMKIRDIYVNKNYSN